MSMKWVNVLNNEFKDSIKDLNSLNNRVFRVSLDVGANPKEYYRDYKRIENRLSTLEREFKSLFEKLRSDPRFVTLETEGKYKMKAKERP